MQCTNNRGQFRLPEVEAGKYALVSATKASGRATVTIVLPDSARKHLELVLISEQALSLPVSASLGLAADGLSQSGTNNTR